MRAMHPRTLLPLLALLAAAGCASRANPPRLIAAPDPPLAEIRSSVPLTDFEAGTFAAGGGIVLPYRLLRPRQVEPGRTYPLVVIFHGSGAIGSDNASQIGPVARSWATPAVRERYPVFVLVPQFPDRSAVYRDIGTPRATSAGTPLLHAALALVDDAVRTLPVDAQRVYAIGFSMGGSAVWNALALRPGLFAAAVSVAGVPNPAALRRGRTRLLLVHGDADEENPFSAILRVYGEARSPRVELWQYQGLGHEFPADLVTGTALAEWLLRVH